MKNLVVNALDALSETDGTRPRRLLVLLKSSRQRLLCQVSDTANGIPNEDRSRIFEPFFSTKPRTGTGLGLGMVQKLVALHDGTLEFETVAGRGTTFTLSFPIEPATDSENLATRTRSDISMSGADGIGDIR